MSEVKMLSNDRVRYNTFLFVSTFAKTLIEVFISLYLFKNGFVIQFIILFYVLENLFALPISYYLVKLGEKVGYAAVMGIGILSFVTLQLALNTVVNNEWYILAIAVLYTLYRRGYWVARRYYVTEVVPQRNSAQPFSIMMVVSEVASILAGFVGGLLLDGFNALTLTIISSVLLIASVVPLLGIKSKTHGTKIELMKNLRKYDRRNYLAFSLYEINNLLAFIFPIFITLYIKDTYMMAGSVNAVSSLAIIVFILIYGRLIRKKNYFVVSSILFVLVCFAKLVTLDYLILALCFVEGIVKKMQEQSVNKIYFENRNEMDLAHYNLIYQMLESVTRAVVAVPLLFMSDVRVMIVFVLVVICAEVVIYACLKKSEKLK